MEQSLAILAGWLDGIGVGPWARGSSSVYPVANILHLLGLVMLVGGIGVVDLRIAGLWRSIPVTPLARALTPVAAIGLALMVPSGAVLFAADGTALAKSATFQVKLVLIALALANAGLFRLLWQGRSTFPLLARAMAAASVGLWLTIAAYGRWIAYS
ncbi:DUF6644 family protein [Sphingomonas japonica]|uniref:DUF6644 domain-containing protein n=1 Tax=Sphingomonas japonica TaxID=511662 RepID=A0ABX0U2E8_9SPHN|nr:DUF6644 family protein [Sphingomonas japonica]NIJ22893.1 hypothetical protein [Sphingomonas japonica]